MHKEKAEGMPHMKHMHYYHLLVMAVLSFLAMYVLMHSMVNAFSNVYANYNQFYMAGLMTAPMVLIELIVMRSMHQDKRLNTAIIAISLVALAGFFLMTRQQTAIGDKQFLRSMIPHHAGARKLPSRTPNCQRILTSQQSEIDQMKRKLAALD
jgi:uncharacterized protein (DUF305 family)